ncbi:hypothetical protein [Mesorhizobium sp.]|uniref:hypothetical protein n=1 Tax=Mesorhizobium sp. TaxID=1871066 RepID=UPI000FE7417C|nr:hypothetical protein [Mesorhizobium sp.]RWC50481.1 MAG: hypothetical protein EOS55_00675 [Mesorhizobium sp.]RWC62380.1 MAG: hypothetical protein EOS56_07405 [Mesorhizobium sp.]RWC65686.1 MAG: hypothetical protein EOS29_07570 [Mesorhizobium sp.]
MAAFFTSQQLTGIDTSANIQDALAARVKDPLWFLARQWQTGEFEAENGGSASHLSIVWREFPVDRLVRGNEEVAIPADMPMDFVVEQEDDEGGSPLWRSEALLYDFSVKGKAFGLEAKGYGGRNLDWYHFDLASSTLDDPPPETETRMVPSTLSFRGAPHPRWWRFEDGDAYFEQAKDPEPNSLSMLLPEFFFIDVNNWYVAPLPQTAGTVRQITELSVVDGFGVVTEIGPSISDGNAEWSMFSLTQADGRTTGDLLYVPNIAIEVLDNDEVEEVLFSRDEEANLVWASERLVTLADGTQVRNGERDSVPSPERPEDPRPVFRLRSDVAPWRIPYVARFTNLSAANGEIYLRRARTVEGASLANPQYRSVVVGESWRLDEAQIPRSGVRIRRSQRFARGSDGEGYFWIGRGRQTAPHTDGPNLRFDYLDAP